MDYVLGKCEMFLMMLWIRKDFDNPGNTAFWFRIWRPRFRAINFVIRTEGRARGVGAAGRGDQRTISQHECEEANIQTLFFEWSTTYANNYMQWCTGEILTWKDDSLFDAPDIILQFDPHTLPGGYACLACHLCSRMIDHARMQDEANW